MAWTNVVAAAAVGSLGVYLIRRAPTLSREEQEAFRFGDRYRASRVWSPRFGGIFLLAVAVALVVAGIR
jgi:hypothetical protein